MSKLNPNLTHRVRSKSGIFTTTFHAWCGVSVRASDVDVYHFWSPDPKCKACLDAERQAKKGGRK